jgi:predicted TPR repeat methyltransferase
VSHPFDPQLDQAIALHSQGEYAHALEIYQQILEAHPDGRPAHRLIAKLYCDQGDPEEALPRLQELLLTDPDDTLTRYYLAEAQHACAQSDDAIATLQQLLSHEPEHIDALYLLGCLYVDAGNAPFALEIFDRLCHLQPRHAEALNYLGILRQERNEPALAEHYFRQAIKANKHFTEAHINLGNLLAEEGRAEEALNQFSRALVISPLHPDALFNLAVFQQSRQRTQEAEALYRQLIAHIPDHVDAMNNLGLLLDSNGQSDEAEALWQNALTLQPDYINALFNLGNLCHARRQTQHALAFYQEILEIQPDNVSARYLVDALNGTLQDQAPDHYVRDLFDSFAPAFEKSLIEELAYRTPEVLSEILRKALPQGRRFSSVIDLGCGTGLMGVQIAPWCDQLTGVDLSPGMLERARQKGIYHALHEENLITFLEARSCEHDLITATDVFVYIGDLEPVFAAAVAALKSGGYFLFSTEKGKGASYTLTSSGRFQHSSRYVRQLASRYGFKVLTHHQATVRTENGKPVTGDCFLLQRK